MATLTVRTISFGTYTPGATPKYGGLNVATLDSPAALGDQFACGNRTFLFAKNANASARTVTVDAKKASDQGITTDVVVDIPATTGAVMWGPFEAAQFGGSTGLADITYDAVTDLTIVALKLAETARG
jgi:uncharacterized Zn-binding protein involved in type VI secretion